MSDPRVDREFRNSVRTARQSAGVTRTENDSLGAKEIPACASQDRGISVGVSDCTQNTSASVEPTSDGAPSTRCIGLSVCLRAVPERIGRFA